MTCLLLPRFFSCKISKHAKTQINIVLFDGFDGFDGESGLGWFRVIRNLLGSEIFHFPKAVPLMRMSHLPGQLAPYNQLLIHPLLLVSECSFYWLHFFWVMISCLSWYLHLKHVSWGSNISHLTFEVKA